MKQITLGTGLKVPAMAIGCMRISDKTTAEAAALVEAALECGINFFDHADIYGGGRSEEVFAAAVKELGIDRDSLIIQTKCGIRSGYYDFSKEHILTSVENSLKRLGTDHVDFLLLHRPDTLMEPDEVAEAFAKLKYSGKVRGFGVSNFNSMQIELLQQATVEPLLIDQLQFGPAHTGMIDSGLNANVDSKFALDHDGSILEYCRLKKMTIQAWSPFQYGMFQGLFWTNPEYDQAVAELDKLAEQYGVSREAMCVAWIARHPANIQTILGTTNPDRVRSIAQGDGVVLTREEWYRVYRAAGNPLP